MTEYGRKSGPLRNRWCIWEQRQLKHLEVNAEHDVSRMEFIKENAAERQKYILTNVKSGDEIKLKRVIFNGKIGYEILHCTEEEMLLGRMRSSFIDDLKLLTSAKTNIEYLHILRICLLIPFIRILQHLII